MAKPPANADPVLVQWFRSLKEPGTRMSCCGIAECREVDYRTNGDLYEVLVEGRWIDVPPRRVLEHIGNPTGRGVACVTPKGVVKCFVRAPEG